MKIPFDTHTIFITLDDDQVYELKRDFSKVPVSKVTSTNKQNPKIMIHKKQFDAAKGYLLDKENPFKISNEDANMFYQLGFITLDEKTDYINMEQE